MHYQADNDSVVNHVVDDTNDTYCSDSQHTRGMKKNSTVFVQENPETNVILSHRNNIRTIPGNSLFSKVVTNGKQIGMFADSMIKRILVVELVRILNMEQ